MTPSDIPPEEIGDDEQSESVAAPHREQPPRRGVGAFVWVAIILLAAAAVAALVLTVWGGLIADG